MDRSFKPFAPHEVLLVTDRRVTMLTKYIGIEGVSGKLYLDLWYPDPGDIPKFDSPWSLNRGFPYDPDFPLELGAGLVESANVTPKFELKFPGAPRDRFLALVSDWGDFGKRDVNKKHNATCYIYDPEDLIDSVNLAIPPQHMYLLSMEVTPLSELIYYPEVYGVRSIPRRKSFLGLTLPGKLFV